ncbi:MAG: hypothetical protein OK457_05545 [Thaumarchaeota archaeon]|nr:hypothetical protein [Nitrososphaerota archaeon]
MAYTPQLGLKHDLRVRNGLITSRITSDAKMCSLIGERISKIMLSLEKSEFGLPDFLYGKRERDWT